VVTNSGVLLGTASFASYRAGTRSVDCVDLQECRRLSGKSKGEPVNSESSKKPSLKRNIIHQVVDLVKIFVYLAFCFCSIATYKMLLLNQFQVSYFDYGAALINALVVAKVILLGQDAHLGKKTENESLFVSAIYKAFLFGLLVFGFHVVEEAIKRLWHGDKLAGALHNLRIDDLLARSVIMFSTFIPLFAFLELRRVIGEDDFHNLVFRAGTVAKLGLSGPQAHGK
jgi:hypothetical protein